MLLVLLSLTTTVAGAAEDAGPWVVRVYYDDVREIGRLAEFDLFEHNDRDERYVLAGLDQADYAEVASLGFRLEIDEARTAELREPRVVLPTQVAGIPGYPCYRTVEETFETAAEIAAEHPELATWIDVGDSWAKSVGQGGYDLWVLRLTRADVPGPKPKLFITSAIHAREYTPAELNTRFAEYLVNGYGTDADATWLLDYHEIHLMLQANPDGRKHAETGEWWRKNTNQAHCSPASSNRGADLNRNFDFEWGCCGGASTNECSSTYRGPWSASEPETRAVQDYMAAQFPDQRDPPLDAPAPRGATGVYIDLHSYSELVLWPWGFYSAAPNAAQLRTFGRKLAYFNGYTPQQAVDLYVTDGTTLDFGYGELGLATYTFELGTTFFQPCHQFQNTILPANLPALIYAAKVARTPYLTPSGPDALDVAATPETVERGAMLELTATIDDTRYNHENGVEPDQAIADAECYIDRPPWAPLAAARGIGMLPTDGRFDASVEEVGLSVDTTRLAGGRHIAFVRGRDADGNWGAFSAVFFAIADE